MQTIDLSAVPTPVTGRQRLAFADAVRGLAAFWVVLFHLSVAGHLNGLGTLLPEWLRSSLFDNGHLGVAVFFVLSGFVMALNVVDANVDDRFATRFIARRFVRLTPPYYVAILVALAYLFVRSRLTGDALHVPNGPELLAHALYLQGLAAIPDINPVFWTLCVEVQFYAAFALLVRVADGGVWPATRAGLLLTTGTACLLWPLGVIDGPLWPGNFMPYWYCFAAGALACWGWQVGGSALTMALGFNALLWSVALLSRESYALVAAVTTSLLLFSALRGRMNRWLDLRWAQFLGLISYSLYLLHNHVIGTSYFLARRLLAPGLATELLALALALTVSILAAWIMYRLVERPSIDWSRRIRIRPRPLASDTAVADTERPP